MKRVRRTGRSTQAVGKEGPGRKRLPLRWLLISLTSALVGGSITSLTGVGDGAVAAIGTATLLDQILE